MLSDSVIAVSTLLLAIAFLSGHKSVWLLFAALVVRSAGTGIQTPAVNAMIPQIVPQTHFMKINGINSTLSSMMMFLSPAASGAILSVAPLEATLFIDVLTAVIGVGITATIHVRPYERRVIPGNTGLKEIRDGFRYLKENRFIKRLLLFQITILILVSPSAFLTPLMVSRTFGREVWRLTASEMTYSLGMVLGGILIASWGGFKKRMNTTMAAGAIYGLIMIGLGNAGVFLLYLLLNTAIGVVSPCYNAPITVTIQEKVGDTLSLSLGSVSSGDSGDITTLGNERDKFKTIIKYGSWEPAKTFTITKSQAKTEATFRNALHILYTSTMSIFGGLVGVIASLHSLFINSFYADPSEAAGKYTVKRCSATKYQQNILTGKSAIIEKGYQFQITHNGKTVNKTF